MDAHRRTTSTSRNTANTNGRYDSSPSGQQNEVQACPHCGGLGYVTRDVPVNHPDFGKAFVCVCQRERVAAKRYQRMLKISNLQNYAHMQFENFVVERPGLSDPQRNSLRTALSLSMQFVEGVDGHWLVLQGTYGTGKTHLAAAIGNFLVENGYNVLFLTVPDLLDHLRTTFDPSADMRYGDLFEMVRSVRVLILDDLGTEAPTQWAGEKLFQLLNDRYIRELPTVITTNHSVEDLDKRIASRLQDRRFVWRSEINVPDYRSTFDFAEDITESNPYRSMRFDNFKAYTENLQRAVQLAREYGAAPDGWLLLHGDHGSGKTHLAAAIANERRAKGQTVTFLTAADLFDYLRDAFNSKHETVNERLQFLRETPLLVIDGVNLRSATGWTAEKLFQLVDYRYMLRKPMLLTASTDDLRDMDTRFSSRFLDSRICRMFEIRATPYYKRAQGTSYD